MPLTLVRIDFFNQKKIQKPKHTGGRYIYLFHIFALYTLFHQINANFSFYITIPCHRVLIENCFSKKII